ncbi:MAG: hypothetical protein LRY51_07170 [Geovibrio sp.]|nr:hypothetical protein [Geovibrio sp.]
MRISPLTERRLRRFRGNRRAWYSLIMFSFLFLMSLCAEIIANDKPLIMSYNGKLYFPVLFTYTESEFGGFFDTEADYRDPFMLESIEENGWQFGHRYATATTP